MLIDLQLHSTYSDGYLTPTELVDFMYQKGVKVAAVTDHNTVGGIDEFIIACGKKNIRAIKGLELYTRYNTRKFNILWYNFDETNPKLHALLRGTHLRRRRSIRQALEKLNKHGFKINVELTLDKHNHYIPINRIVDDIMATPHNAAKVKKLLETKHPNEGQIIHKLFRNPKLAKIENSLLDIKKIAKLKKGIGGQLVLCHPGKRGQTDKELWKKLKKLGIDGIELLSPHHSYDTTTYLQELAREVGFTITTGGSDFHRMEGCGHYIQKAWDYYQIRAKKLKGIKRIIG